MQQKLSNTLSSSMMISLRVLRAVACALATVTAGAARAAPTGVVHPLSPGAHKVLIDQRVSGVRRSYYVHVPAGHDGKTPLPVVVALHGAFSTARNFEEESGFSLLADRESFIVVYPQGIGLGNLFRHWNSGHCCGKAKKQNIDDVGFVLRDHKRRGQAQRGGSGTPLLVGIFKRRNARISHRRRAP